MCPPAALDSKVACRKRKGSVCVERFQRLSLGQALSLSLETLAQQCFVSFLREKQSLERLFVCGRLPQELGS